MGLHNDEKRACKEFLDNFTTGPDPTWGFYVYATYTRPQEQKEADSDQNSSSDKTAGMLLVYSVTRVTNALYKWLTTTLISKTY
jgi:hypothetical protein